MDSEKNNFAERENEKLLMERLIARVRKYREQVGIKEYIKWAGSVRKMIHQAFHEEARQYRFWHEFCGSGGYENEPYFDFPGKFSIQKLIENLPIDEEDKTKN